MSGRTDPLRRAIFVSLSGWLALTLPLAAGAAGAPTVNLDHVTLQLKWKHQFQFAGYYAAVAQGYYREAGLEVSLREAVADHDPVDEVLQGRAEFGVGTSDLVLLRGQGKPVVALAVIYQHSPLVLLARKAAGAEDLQALAMRPVMIEPQAAELFAYFKAEGVNPAKLQVVTHTFDVQDLIGGKVAAMSAYSTDEPFQLKSAGVDYLTFTPRAGGIDFYGDNLFTTEAQIRAHPERVAAFRRASLRGWDYALAHAEELTDLILHDYGQRKSRAALLFEAQQTTELMHPELIEVGHMNPGRWRHIADTYAEFGLLPAGFSLDGFLYDPNPQPDYHRLYWTLAIISAVAAAALGWALPLVRLNRRLSRSEKQYRDLIEQAPFPVSVSDFETNRIVFANRSAAAAMMAPVTAIEGEMVAGFYDNPADREQLLGELRAGRPVTSFEVRLRTPGGQRVWALMSAAGVEFSGRRSILVAFQDITQRREMQDELHRAKDAAEAANAAKSLYLAVMAHEVRTPLSGIIGLVQLIQEEALTREQRENAVVVESTAESLLALIGNILDFSKIEAGRMEVEQYPMEAAPLLDDLRRLFSSAAQAKNLALTVHVDPGVPAAVLTDPTRLRQILGNLLSNAIKFTSAGAIELRVTAARTDNGRWRLLFQVRDTGAGIAPGKLERLFQPYSQADKSVARRHGGTGLGLAISRQLARLLGGDLTVTSTLGHGSTFAVEITAAPLDLSPS
jgi:PAS domain S-box-containing protein